MKTQRAIPLCTLAVLAVCAAVGRPAPATAATIYYVGNTSEDDGLKQHFSDDLGYDVVARSGTTASYAEAKSQGADLIIISGTLGSIQASGKGFHTSRIPILSFEPYSYDDFGWTGSTASTDFGDSNDDQQNLDIAPSLHPITSGLGPGTIAVYNSANGRFSYGVPDSSADVLATYPGPGAGNGKAAIFVYELGDTLKQGTNHTGVAGDLVGVTQARSRYIGFFLNEYGVEGSPADSGDIFTELNANGRQLLDQAVAYAMSPPTPIARWTFDQNLADSVGDNDGTAFGGAAITHAAGETFLTGGGALKLNRASSQYVTVNGLGDEGLTTGADVTITMWFNTDAAPASPSDNVLFSAHTASGGNLLRMGTGANGGIYLNPTDLSGAVPDEEFGSGYNDGQWHFLSVVLEADGTSSVYVDLDEVTGFTDYTGQPKWSTAALFSFGQEWDGGSPSNFYDGLIADARIYNTRLTGFQLEAIYNSALPEPGTCGLLALGSLGAVVVLRRRRAGRVTRCA